MYKQYIAQYYVWNTLYTHYKTKHSLKKYSINLQPNNNKL